MKAFNQSSPNTVREAGLILLFDGEVDPAPAGPRRAQPNRYPDLGPPTSLPPSRLVTSGCGSS